ncbi:hypothetical protein GUJ93_ZPchr0005g16114 [Zizania palustris]|uniref:UspA domain-containing protein n=1 Tax=Zizania palustris TaxID=103762 RepID=A0A8J5SWY4_ZIZPA|nr:hypothetical protein GUJ93_ZPchr0005g16114 [Zizania palustris]
MAGSERMMTSAGSGGWRMDYSDSSKRALDWAISNLLRRSDNRASSCTPAPTRGGGQARPLGKSGSPSDPPPPSYRDPTAMQQYGVHCDAELTVVAKLYWGDAREKLCDSVEEQKIDTLVMGSRGLGSIQRILLGKRDNYCCCHSASCPVDGRQGELVEQHPASQRWSIDDST